MIDQAWSVREPRGFRWWPHRLAQRVWADEPLVDGGVVGCRLHAEIEVARPDAGQIGGDGARADDILASLMRFPPLSAFTRDQSSGAIHLWCGVFLQEALASFLLPRFATATMLQATFAELGRERLAELTGSPPVESAHPKSGLRPRPDDMLNLAAARILPAGREASRWRGESELAAVAAELEAQGARASTEPLGLNARFPFRKGAADPFAPRDSSLLQVRSEEPHPELGHGVFLRLFLPVWAIDVGAPSLASTALRLNDLERLDPRHSATCLGSFTVERSEPEVEMPGVLPGPPRLAYVLFVPNFLYAEGALRNFVLDMVERAAWAARVIGERAI